MIRIAVAIAMAAAAHHDGVEAAEILSLSSSLADEKGDDRSRAIACLANAVLFEAGHEPLAGQEAVAEVVMNRLRNPAYPKTICGVVFQGSNRRTGCQFTFTCDGSLRKTLPASLMEQARAVAVSALDGLLVPRLSGATHYHADYVQPYWASSLVKVTAIGRHIFYRLPGAQDLHSASRYIPSNERLPLSKTDDSNTAVANTGGQSTPSGKPAFTPWGLTPAVQTATASDDRSVSKE